jgi:hypothetical protein
MARKPQSEFDLALAKYSKAIQEAFEQAVYGQRNAIDLRALADALQAGDIDRAARLAQISPNRILALQEASRAAFLGAGQAIPLPSAIAAEWAFGGRNVRAETWLASKSADLVQVMAGQEEVRGQIRAILTDGAEKERSAADMALQIAGRLNRETGRREGGVIGLTSQQTEYAINARAELESLDAGYFDRALRDKRYDKIVRKAIESGKPLSLVDIDRITARYKDKMLAYRGRMIANNEAITAMAAGQFEAHLQVLALPNVAGVLKRWQHNLSVEPRPDHLAANGTVLPLLQDFVIGGVAMSHPHDPRGGAKHSIGCRCVAVYRVQLR